MKNRMLAQLMMGQTAQPVPSDQVRNDGTRKGGGYLGVIPDATGRPMTEFSIGVNMDGKEVEIPTLVPTLDADEIEYLRSMKPGTMIPLRIRQKAVDHAKSRMSQGLSPFAE